MYILLACCNGTDRKLVVSNRISLGILDMSEFI